MTQVPTHPVSGPECRKEGPMNPPQRTRSRRAHALRFGALVLALCLTAAAAADSAERLAVPLDFAEVVSLDRPVATIVIGNPAIIDATLPDSQTIIVTAKKVGATNLIVFAEDGMILRDLEVQVRNADQTRTIVYNGATREAYVCDIDCRLVDTSGPSLGQGRALPDG